MVGARRRDNHLWRRRAEAWIFGSKHSLRAIAICRILIALCVIGVLIANFWHRSIAFGVGAVWAEPARAVSRFPTEWFSGVAGGTLTIAYALVAAAAVAFGLGWHTRLAGAITLAGYVIIVSQNPLLSGNGDDLVRLALIWLLFLHSSAHLSFDEQRRATLPGLVVGAAPTDNDVSVWRTIWNSHPILSPAFTNGIHNLALVAVIFQTILIYLNAGMFKVQSELWSSGTALYYALEDPANRVIPWINDFITSSSILVAIGTYAIVILQVFFAPLLLNKVAKPVVLTLAVAMKLMVAVVLADPLAGFAMIALLALLVTDDEFERLVSLLDLLPAPVEEWLVNRYYDILDGIDWARERGDDLWFWSLDQFDRVRGR